MLGHTQLLRVKSLLLELKDFVLSANNKEEEKPTKYPYLVERVDGYIYYSKNTPRFIAWPESPGQKIVIRGKYVTLKELDRILKDES